MESLSDSDWTSAKPLATYKIQIHPFSRYPPFNQAHGNRSQGRREYHLATPMNM